MASLLAFLVGGEADGEFHEVDSIRTQGNRLLPPEQLSVDGQLYSLVDKGSDYFTYMVQNSEEHQ